YDQIPGRGQIPLPCSGQRLLACLYRFTDVTHLGDQPRRAVGLVFAHSHEDLLLHLLARDARKDCAEVGELCWRRIVTVRQPEYRVRTNSLVLARVLDDRVQRGDRAGVTSLSEPEYRGIAGAETSRARDVDQCGDSGAVSNV